MSFRDIFTKAKEIEELSAELYKLFQYKYPEDRDFWWRMHLEEKNHSSILDIAHQIDYNTNDFPNGFMDLCLDEITLTATKIKDTIKEFNNSPFLREEAFNTALRLEVSLCELDFQRMLLTKTTNPIINIFQDLKIDNRHHAEVITEYMTQNGITIQI